MKRAVLGIVDNIRQAETLVSQLKASGFTTKDISVLFPNAEGAREFGGVFALLAGIGALTIPGLGYFIAGGPVMAALSGASVAPAPQGLAMALTGFGIPEADATLCEGKIRDGNLLLAVHTSDPEMRSRADKIFESNGARDVATMRAAAASRHP